MTAAAARHSLIPTKRQIEEFCEAADQRGSAAAERRELEHLRAENALLTAHVRRLNIDRQNDQCYIASLEQQLAEARALVGA